MDTQQILSRIEKEAATHRREPRFVRTCRPGDQIRQGDVYVYPVPAPGQLGAARVDPHLGHESHESNRHALEGDATVYGRLGAGEFEGPYFHARARVDIVHPEHARISIPAGWYEVTYQRDLTRTETLRHRD